MKVLYFDCFSGISGDMTLGALLDLGIDIEQFKNELYKLNIDEFDIIISNKVRNGIVGTDVEVRLHEEHEHTHNAHNHMHRENHKGCHTEAHHSSGETHSHHARNLYDIESLIDASDLKSNVKEFSKKVFREIAAAEAKVHNKNINEVHFHEVGAVDSIADIVGVAICIDLIGAEQFFSSYIHDGSGFIECQHGIIPVPVPAVVEMLKGSNIPLISEDVETELVTPTGCGLIKCLASKYGKMPAMTIEKIGYGIGKRNTGRFNALRVFMGTLFDAET